jgi:hypothetical protein
MGAEWERHGMCELAFTEQKERLVPSGQAAGWATEPVWVFVGGEIVVVAQLSHCAN